MEAFTAIESVLVPLDRANVDTDAIIPKQFLKTISRQGLGQYLFYDWRYLEQGGQLLPNPDFVLNQEPYRNGRILLGRENFGCGSSREHAPWALADYGIRAIVAPSFADIFANNCVQNGILLVSLAEAEIGGLFEKTAAVKGFSVRIDLAEQVLRTADGQLYRFGVDPSVKFKLLHGLDDIQVTLQHQEDIKAYEAGRRFLMPWLFHWHET